MRNEKAEDADVETAGGGGCPGCVESAIVADALEKEGKVTTNPLVLALGFPEVEALRHLRPVCAASAEGDKTFNHAAIIDQTGVKRKIDEIQGLTSSKRLKGVTLSCSRGIQTDLDNVADAGGSRLHR
ncbi:hypothetical protein RIF29_27929 [Crotalaria pallida]|uniref:Uncharacterized protein n=1 Tax=Crotalaria pallida TaxID=3830 RepID=A0AAN9EQ04_CROPI